MQDRVSELFQKLLIELAAQTARERRPSRVAFLTSFTSLVRRMSEQWERCRARNLLGVSDAE